jgi:hypothetical protein
MPASGANFKNPIDVAAYLRHFAEDEQILDKRIAECQKQENSAFKVVQRVDYAALILTVAGMILLIALAWRNF